MTYEEAFRLSSLVALFALLIVSAYTDIMKNKVYNWCTFPGMFLGLSFAYLAGGFNGGGGYNLLDSALGMLVGGGIILLFSLLGGIGMGDVKLMAAVGALVGLKFVFGSLLYSSMVGFVMAMGLLIWRGRLAEGLRSSALYAIRWKTKKPDGPAPAESSPPTGEAGCEAGPVIAKPATPPAKQTDTIPFGAAIAFGTLWAFLMATGRAF